MISNLRLPFLLVAIGAAASTQAAMIASYSFDSDGSSAASEISGVSASDVTLGSGMGSNSSISYTEAGFTSNNLRVQASGGPQDATTAVNNNQFWTFTLTIDNSTTIDLDSLDFLATKGGTSGRGFAVRSSLTGATNLASFDRSFDAESGTLAPLPSKPTFASKSVDLSDPVFQGLTNTSVAFTFYHFAGSGGRDFHFDDVKVNATESVVPEPSSLCLIAVLAAVALLRRNDIASR